MFKNFPKVRIPLPLEYQEIYEQMYKSNRNGETAATSLAQKMEKWLHYKVANDISGIGGYRTLEIGAGTLNQLFYEKKLEHYDVIEPFMALYEDSPNLKYVKNIYKDIKEVAAEHNVSIAKQSFGGGGIYMIGLSRVLF